jgi:hypothetical protein
MDAKKIFIFESAVPCSTRYTNGDATKVIHESRRTAGD